MKLFLLFSVILAVQAAPNKKICSKSSDCSEEECCVGKTPFTDGTCNPLSRLDEFCVPKEMIKLLGENSYQAGCTCAKGLECIPEEVTNEDGEINFKNPKCKQPTSD